MNIKTTSEAVRNMVSRYTDRAEFYQSFLRFVAKEAGAYGGIAWFCNQPPFQPICQVQLVESEPVKIGVSEAAHVELLSRSLQADSSVLVKPRLDGKAKESSAILFAKIETPVSREVVELFLPNRLDDSQYAEKTRLVEELCREASSAASQLVNNQDSTQQKLAALPTSSMKRIAPAQLDEFVHQIHRSLDPVETARQVANETRRILDCDRVSVVKFHGRRSKVTAISGQPSVNNRSNTVFLLRKLVDRVLPTKQEFWFPSENKLPPEIEKPLNEYLGISATRSLILAPIYEQPPQLDERPDPQPESDKVIGGLVIEHCGEEWARNDVANAIDVVTRHASDAVRNAHNHRQIFLYPLWYWIGKSKIVMAARNLPKTIAVAVGLTFLALALAIWPADLKVTCDGTLVPSDKSRVFAGVDGTVREILVEHGATVKTNEALVKLENIELDQSMQDIESQINEANEQIRNLELELLSPTAEDQASIELMLSSEKAKRTSLENQQKIMRKKLDKLNVASPQRGQVVTWNLKDRLKGRPVTRGEQLMVVVDVDGPWQLELDVNDNNIGHVVAAAKSGKQLDVEFILAADPDRTFQGKVVGIGNATELTADQTQVIPLQVEFDSKDLDIRQAGSGVSAKVVCGRTSLGNSLFYGVREFIQRQWFRYF